MGFLEYIVFYTLRVNLSVAIIEMVYSTYRRELQVAAGNASSNSPSCLADERHLGGTDDDDNGKVRIGYRGP